jgi:hypothetical protein
MCILLNALIFVLQDDKWYLLLCLVLGNAQQSHAVTGKHSEGTLKSESHGKHSNPHKNKRNPNIYSYRTRDSISTILTTDVHGEENVSEHGHICIF